MKKFFGDFKKFISRGNIVDMAIGVIVGSAFSTIVTSFTNKIIMPLINWILSFGGENGLSAYTFLKKGYTDETKTVIDLAKSIYIDWGAFITAIINFFIIALTLFIVMKIAMKSREIFTTAHKNIKKGIPTEEEKKALEERGVNLGFSRKERKAFAQALVQYRKEVAEKKAEEERNKPKPETDIDILKDIRELLKSNQEKSEE